MQFPAQNAAPFEFARPVLLLAGLSFFAGFGGYLALSPATASAAHAAPQPAAAHAPASVVSSRTTHVWNLPKKI